MKCTYNFSAGPAVLPKSVMLRAQAEMIDWHDSGMSVMEMSHRGKHYMSIIEKVESDFRSLFNVPKNYKVLFLQKVVAHFLLPFWNKAKLSNFRPQKPPTESPKNAYFLPKDLKFFQK